MRRFLGPWALAAIFIAAAPASFGGWTVITVDDLPEYLEVGRSYPISFTVRQHGADLLVGRSPTVTIRRYGAGWLSRKQRWTAEDDGRPGHYQTTITPRETGEVSITIDADFHRSNMRLLPMTVVAAGEVPAPLTPSDRGRQLFVSKGCVTCHVTRDDPPMALRNQITVGPELTGRRFDPTWLATKLADPARNRVRFDQWTVMPDLDLDEPEIRALVGYINGRSMVGTH